MLRFLTLSLVLLSAQANAQISAPHDQFAEADQLFEQRAGNNSRIANSRALYLQALQGANLDETAYIVQQVGRLALYEGYYLVNARDRGRLTRLYDQCRKTAANLADAGDSYLTIYAYWNMACTSLWLKYAPVMDRLGEISAIKSNFNTLINEELEVKPELNIDTRYMGGGLNRVLAGVYANSLSNLIRSDLPNAEKAMDMVNRAINSRPYPSTSLWGSDVYRNYTQKVELFLEADATDAANELIDDTVTEIRERIEDEDLPEGMEAETIAEADHLETLRREDR